jgi:hypothetical protein
MTETGNEKFGATVTNNASVVVKALLITEGKYSHIAVYTCVAHTLDTCKSIIKEIKKVANTEGPLYRAPERNGSDLLSKNSSAH